MALGDNVIHPLWICDTSDAVEPCEPRARAVPEVGSPVVEPPRPLGEPVRVIPGAVHLPNGDVVAFGPLQPSYSVKSRGHGWVTVTAPLDWSRGFDYDSLGEGHYPDDTVNP